MVFCRFLDGFDPVLLTVSPRMPVNNDYYEYWYSSIKLRVVETPCGKKVNLIVQLEQLSHNCQLSFIRIYPMWSYFFNKFSKFINFLSLRSWVIIYLKQKSVIWILPKKIATNSSNWIYFLEKKRDNTTKAKLLPRKSSTVELN